MKLVSRLDIYFGLMLFKLDNFNDQNAPFGNGVGSKASFSCYFLPRLFCCVDYQLH